jgi:D-beta-D-heptose 7-phosphate kinase/D-beta-D-heptose 1-phosphate adenosyltransferase
MAGSRRRLKPTELTDACTSVAITSGIFGSDANFDDRVKDSLDALADFVTHLRGIGLHIVLTSGSFDLIHLGHVKYLARAKALGDVLVVGVDSDDKIRRRKGEDRPLVPQQERLEMLAHQRPVDLLYLKQDADERWGLIRAVRPDVLVVTEDHSYSDDELEALHELCGEIRVIERQAAITTSERIRQLYMHLGERLGPRLAEVLPGLIDNVLKRG